MPRDYKVNLVFCIDTGSDMQDVLPDIKKKIIGFSDQFKRAMLETGGVITHEQVKVILSKEKLSGNIIKDSGFFQLPDEKKSFQEAVHAIDFDNEKSKSTLALDALIRAVESKWNNSYVPLSRNVIILWTKSGVDNKTTVAKLEEFASRWHSMNFRHKRLILFAPEVYPWVEICENLDNTLVYFSDAGKGIADEDYIEIIKLTVSAF